MDRLSAAGPTRSLRKDNGPPPRAGGRGRGTRDDWPGNIRELKNVVERSVILCTGDTLRVEETLAPAAPAAEAASSSSSGRLKPDLQAVERSRILSALEECGWRVKGPGYAADRLGLSPSTLRSRMKRLGIERPRPS